MKVSMIDFTGAGSPNPARHAANVLVFTKSTRLNMRPGLMAEIADWPAHKIQDELEYMAKTIPSSWEFCHYTALIEDVTRAFTHQFVRTRNGSYAQQTMRVLDVGGWTYGTGPSIEKDQFLKAQYDDAMANISASYDSLIENGAEIEDARGVLPTNIHTNIVCSFNLRTLAEISRKRASSRTQNEYRKVLDALKVAIVEVHPWASLFLDQSFDAAAQQLEDEILDMEFTKEYKTKLIKLIDQMRTMS